MTMTSQRNTLVVVDEKGAPLRAGDPLGGPAHRAGGASLSPGWRLLFTLAGQTATVDYLQRQAKVNWLQYYEPQTWARTRKVLFLSGYLSHQLTGNLVDSTGCQVGFLPFDFKGQDWAGKRDWKWQAPGDRSLPDDQPG